MAIPDMYTIQDRFSIDGGDEIEYTIPWAGTWKLVSGTVTPYTTLAAHASNTQTITVYKGAAGTALGFMTSDSDDTTYGAAYTKGTTRSFVFTESGKNMEITGQTGCVEVAVTEGGTCAAVDCSIALCFERVR